MAVAGVPALTAPLPDLAVPRVPVPNIPLIARLLFPNLAAMLAAAALVYCLFIFGGGERLFRDSDTGWHIRNGQWILAHSALPRTDPYSFSKPGQPFGQPSGQIWMAWEWGSDAIMGWMYDLDGLRGVVSLFALTVAAAAWMWCRLNFAAGGDFFLTALLAAPMITTASLHWLARPHLLSWLFALGAVWFAETATPHFGLAKLAWIAAVTAIWANLHGSFLLAPVIALIYAFAHVVRPLLWAPSAEIDPSAEHAKARWFLWAALAALAGSFANPYGWHLHAHILSYLSDEDLTSRVAEFQSFNFHDPDAAQVTLTMLVAASATVLALAQKRLAQGILMALLVWGGLRSARVIPLVALLALPLANGAIARALRSVSTLRPLVLRPEIARRLARTLRYSRGLEAIDRRLTGAVFLIVIVFFSLVALRAPAQAAGIGFSPARFPVAAADAVAKLPADARLLAPDSYGGYLIYRFNGARKVYFDGRSDFYGAAFMKQYLILIQARPGWQEIVRAYGFDYALLPEDSALKAALQQEGWSTMYADKTATLLRVR
jgi:hypothetical protein